MAEKKKDDEKEKPTEGEEAAPLTEEEQAALKKKKKKKKLMMIVGVVVLLLAIVGGLFAAGVIGGKKAENAEGEQAAEGEHGEAAKGEGEHGEGKAAIPGAPVYYTLPEFLVNLNVATGGKQTSFLKTTIVLQLEKPDDAKTVEANLPRLLDNMNTYLREMRPTDISGSAGIFRLREELTLRANKTLAPLKVQDVLFKEIIVQ